MSNCIKTYLGEGSAYDKAKAKIDSLVKKGMSEVEAESTVRNKIIEAEYKKIHTDLNALKKASGLPLDKYEPLNLITKKPKYDKENVTRIPSEEPKREEPIKAEPDQERGRKEAGPSRDVQGDEQEKVTYKKVKDSYYVQSIKDGKNIFTEVKGKKVTLEGNDNEFFIYKRNDDNFVVSDAVTGTQIGKGKTQKEAIKNAQDTLERNKSIDYAEAVKRQVERSGISPRYEQPLFQVSEEKATTEQKAQTQKIIDFFNEGMKTSLFAPLTDFKSKLKELGYDSLKAMVEAWQGSPHRFNKELLVSYPDGRTEYLIGTPDEFPKVPKGATVVKEFPLGRMRTEKIGTGEGAQAFGWGLYFTDLESIARDYADKLTEHSVYINGEEVTSLKGTPLYDVYLFIFGSNNIAKEQGKQSAIANLEQAIRDNRIDYNEAKKAIEYLKGLDSFSVKKDKRNLYKVSLHKGKTPDQYTWLEWDKKPNKNQVNNLFSKLNQNQIDKGFYYGLSPDETNGSFYKKLSKALGSDKAASLFLLENGIDGIKYLAESISRGSTSDTARGFNYVVFDENAVTIEEQIKFVKTPQGQVLGFVSDGKIYLNPDALSPETTFHELAHVQQELLSQAAEKGDKNAKAILDRFKELLKDPIANISKNRIVEIGGVKIDLSSEVYNQGENESDADYEKRMMYELWAYLQAPENVKKWEEASAKGNTGAKGVLDLINQVIEWFKEKLGIKGMTLDQIRNATLEQLIENSSNSLMKKEYFDLLQAETKEVVDDGKKSLIDKITEVLGSDVANRVYKGGKISVKNAALAIKKLSKINTQNEEEIDNYIDYIGELLKDAEYDKKLSEAQALKTSIKKLSKSKTANPTLVAYAKKFAEINPKKDLDTYINFATQLKESLKGVTKRLDNVKIQQAINLDELSTYIEKNIKEQRDKALERKLNKIKKSGVDIDGLTAEEIEYLLTGSKEVKVKDFEKVKSYFNEYADYAKKLIRGGINPITNEPFVVSESTKKLVAEFVKMDISILKDKTKIAALNALVNFVQIGSIAQMNNILAEYTGLKNIQEVSNKNIKTLPLSYKGLKQVGRTISEYLTNLNIVLEKIFVGATAGDYISDKMGLNKFKKGVRKSKIETDDIINEYIDEFFKQKPNNQEFNSLFNNVERWMGAFLQRTVSGTEKEQQLLFKDRKNIIEESIEALKNGNEIEVEKGNVYEEVYKKFKDAKNIDEIKMDPVNQKAVDFWKEKFADKYEQLSDLALGTYNTELEKDINYIPDRYSLFSGVDKEVMAENESAFFFNNGNTYKSESGSLKKATRPSGIPKEEGQPKRYIDFSDSIVSNSMSDALTDLYTADATRQIIAFTKSPLFNKLIPNVEDRNMLLGRINDFILNSRGKSQYSADELSKMAKTLNQLASIGTGLALVSVVQPVVQTIPIYLNTVINTQSIPNIVPSQAKINFLRKSSATVAIRGLQSLAQIDSVNKLIDQASKSRGQKALNLIAKANETLLKLVLSRPDVFIAQSSWFAYYEKSLRQQGIKGDINYNTHELNQKAADYANMQVDRQQNISDQNLGGKLFTSKDAITKIVAKTIFSFATFRLNQSARIGSDLRVILNPKLASTEDIKIATASLAGTIGELLSYKFLAIGASMLLAYAASEISGEDDDEKREKDYKNIVKGAATSSAVDLLSPTPLTDAPVQYGFGKLLKGIQDVLEIPEKKQFNTFEDARRTMATGLGAIGVIGERATNLAKMIWFGSGETMTDEYGGERKATSSQQETLQMMVGPMFLSSIGLLPREVYTISNRVLKDILSSKKSRVKQRKSKRERANED